MKRIVSLVAAAAVIAAGALGATSSAQSGTLPVITVTLTKTTIAVGGTLQSGAVTIRSTTSGEPDGAVLMVRLNPGVTADQALAFAGTKAGRDINNFTPYGSVVLAADAPKGTSDVQTALQPGNYLALEISEKLGPAKSPRTTFTIAQASQPAVLPAPTANVSAIEFGFRAPKTLRNGDLVRFKNAGFLVHMIVGVRVANATAAKQLKAAMVAGNQKKQRSLARGFAFFMGPVSPGAVQQFKVKAQPGLYVLACFEDTQDRREHTKLKMYRTIRIAP